MSPGPPSNETECLLLTACLHRRSHTENGYAAGHADQQRLKPVPLLAPTLTYTEHSSKNYADSPILFVLPSSSGCKSASGIFTETHTCAIWVPQQAVLSNLCCCWSHDPLASLRCWHQDPWAPKVCVLMPDLLSTSGLSGLMLPWVYTYTLRIESASTKKTEMGFNDNIG